MKKRNNKQTTEGSAGRGFIHGSAKEVKGHARHNAENEQREWRRMSNNAISVAPQ